MKGLFGVVLSFLLSYSKNDVVKELEPNECGCKTSFSNLDADCMFIILANLNLGDLINVAQVNSAMSTHAADVFRHKYSHRNVAVIDEFKFPDKLQHLMTTIDTDKIERLIEDQSYFFKKTTNLKEDTHNIYLRDYVSMFKTFKYFGHEIKKLTIDTYPMPQPWKTEFLSYLISEFSSQSLVEVAFSNVRPSKLMNQITKPLINVEKVEFQSTIVEFKTLITDFGGLFPAVRRLDLITVKNEDLVNFNYHMPHLEHISLSRQSIIDSVVPDVIIKNPQIRSIYLKYPEAEFLQKVNILLPQLETLQLECFILESGSIRFENVTTFETHYEALTAPDNLHFPKLSTFVSYGNYIRARFENFFAFLNEHNHMSHLHLKGYYVYDSELQQLTANLQNLVKVTLQYQSNLLNTLKLSAKGVVEFLDSHRNVKQLNVIEYPDQWMADLQEQLEHEWKIKIIDNGLSFERMTNNQVY